MKIVRKMPNEAINQVSFRLNGEKVEWCVEAARDGFWYPTSEHIANHCGTTLAALRDELTEEAPPAHWVEASQEVPPSPAPMEGTNDG